MTVSSRRHWKMVVRDAAGRAIQNAAVYVYQPGTTTSFTGSAYDALTGGSTVSNPLITNAQGEVEAWFTTPQHVDLLVTDNGDAAYYAGSTGALSFTSFTEHDEIVQVTDLTDANISDIAIGDTADTGTSVLTAPADHVHAFPLTATTPTTIEIADAAAIGSASLPAAADHNHAVGTPTAAVKHQSAGGTGSSAVPARQDHVHPFNLGLGRTTQFTPAANLNEQSIFNITVPGNTVVAGTVFAFRCHLYWTNSTTVAGLTLRLRWDLSSANILLASSGTLTSTGTSHTDTPNVFEGLVTFRSTSSAVGDMWGFETITTTGATKTLLHSAITAAVSPTTTADKAIDVTGQIATSNTGINYKVDNVAIWQVA